MTIDHSEGYEGIAQRFMAVRSDVGATLVRSWAREHLPPASSIVDVGCGAGVPIAQALIEDGFTVFGIDASPTLIAACQQRFPGMPSRCEAAQDSAFFERSFAGAVAIGLLFLLQEDDQHSVIRRIADALQPGGRFLFSAPRQCCEWDDVLTGRRSRSLGEHDYRRLLEASGLQLAGCHPDEGGNSYFDAIKPR